MAKGALIEDHDLWELFDSNISSIAGGELSTPTSTLLVIDGIPRCRTQVGELAKRVAIRGVFYLECRDTEELVERLLHRSAIESRADDASKRVVHDRLRLFAEETLPLLDEYPAAIVHRIDASQSPAKVLCDVLAKAHAIHGSHTAARETSPLLAWEYAPDWTRDLYFDDYLRTLAEIGYVDSLTIEREIPMDPARQKAEIAAAITLPEDLRHKMGVA
jgi:adenylate kinase family enzyme